MSEQREEQRGAGELARCPFCGGEAKLLGPVMHDTYDVVCVNPRHPYFVMRGTLAEVFKGWNRRASSSQEQQGGGTP